MRAFFLLTFLLVFFASTASAQVSSNEFGIHLNGPADTEPPTTPTLLSATPIAPTQIDLAWTAATDNAVVSGYVVERDGSPIATTTQLTYADTALLASTTYGYAVRAFDASLNYSSSSNSLATTTPPEPPPSESATSTSDTGTIARVVLRDFRIDPGWSTTTIALTTARPARLEIRWGRTASYELGYVVSGVYSGEHEVILTDLEPGTTYEYEIVGYTPAGFPTVLKRGTFVTLLEATELIPTNVSRFTATAVGDDVALTWQQPLDDNFSHVRVVRSHLGFPEHPQDGAIVYQGTAEIAQDTGVLKQYSPVYYTAFVYDSYGNVSSGAVAIVYVLGETDTYQGETFGVPTTGPGGTRVVTEEATSTRVVERLTPEMRLPELGDITIAQGEAHFVFDDQDIVLQAGERFSISLPKAAVAGNLKTIIASVTDPTDTRKTYSYLLRINKDRTAYEAEIAPLGLGGAAQVIVEIYDYEAFVVGAYQTPVTFAQGETVAGAAVLFPDILFVHWQLLVALVSGLLLVLFFFMLFLHRARAEDNE